MEHIISFTEEEYNYLKGSIDALIEIDKKIPKKFKTNNSIILHQIKEKYFT